MRATLQLAVLIIAIAGSPAMGVGLAASDSAAPGSTAPADEAVLRRALVGTWKLDPPAGAQLPPGATMQVEFANEGSMRASMTMPGSPDQEHRATWVIVGDQLITKDQGSDRETKIQAQIIDADTLQLTEPDAGQVMKLHRLAGATTSATAAAATTSSHP